MHRLGRQCRRLVDATREALPVLLGVSRREVVFCGSMGEANTLAALGLARLQREAQPTRTTVLIARDAPWDSVASVLMRNAFVVRRIQMPQMVDALADPTVALVCTPWMCDTTRSVRDLRPWRRLARSLGALWHVDASWGLLQAQPDACLEDAASVTVGSTPLGGPAGVAALVLQRGISPAPLWGGGGQQRGVRSGTAAVSQVAGMGAAISAFLKERDEAGAA